MSSLTGGPKGFFRVMILLTALILLTASISILFVGRLPLTLNDWLTMSPLARIALSLRVPRVVFSLIAGASLAAAGAASLGVNYVKAGLFGVRSFEEALSMVQAIKDSLRSLDLKVKLVVCGYADHADYGCISPRVLPEVAYKGEAEGILIDVKRKAEKLNLFSYMAEDTIAEIQAKTRDFGLFLALAGGLNLEGIKRCSRLGADIIGVRRFTLTSFGKVSRSLVAEACKAIHSLAR